MSKCATCKEPKYAIGCLKAVEGRVANFGATLQERDDGETRFKMKLCPGGVDLEMNLKEDGIVEFVERELRVVSEKKEVCWMVAKCTNKQIVS